MLDHVSDYRTTAFADRLWPLARRLFAGDERKSRCGCLPKELESLSDKLLLDIGVDPRCVPNPAGEIVSRPDLARSGLVPPAWRSTAKS
jgi:hypothetical protein